MKRAAPALLVAALGALYFVNEARADGIPPADTLFYAGVLEDGGIPVTTVQNVSIALWDIRSGGVEGANRKCITGPTNITPDSGGHFRAALNNTCRTAVETDSTLFVEVQAGTTTFPRVQLGAVPYAVEAATAERARTASGASGDLRTELNNLAARVAIASNGAARYSLDAVFCGTSAGAAVNGDLGGLTGAKALCEAACSSTSAHMCTAEDVLRSRALGVNVAESAWYATGVGSFVPPDASNLRHTDCLNFTSASPGERGQLTANAAGSWGNAGCQETFVVACCD